MAHTGNRADWREAGRADARAGATRRAVFSEMWQMSEYDAGFGSAQVLTPATPAPAQTPAQETAQETAPVPLPMPASLENIDATLRAVVAFFDARENELGTLSAEADALRGMVSRTLVSSRFVFQSIGRTLLEVRMQAHGRGMADAQSADSLRADLQKLGVRYLLECVENDLEQDGRTGNASDIVTLRETLAKHGIE